jgi:hypothetical protein
MTKKGAKNRVYTTAPEFYTPPSKFEDAVITTVIFILAGLVIFGGGYIGSRVALGNHEPKIKIERGLRIMLVKDEITSEQLQEAIDYCSDDGVDHCSVVLPKGSVEIEDTIKVPEEGGTLYLPHYEYQWEYNQWEYNNEHSY